MTYIKLFFIAFVLFIAFDAVWLGGVASSWYKGWFGSLGRYNSSGGFDIQWIAAIGVYLLMALGVCVFLLPLVSNMPLGMVFLWGALLGFIVYGVYDLTNAATLTQWPLQLIIADVAWGTFNFAITTSICVYVGRFFGWI